MAPGFSLGASNGCLGGGIATPAPACGRLECSCLKLRAATKLTQKCRRSVA